MMPILFVHKINQTSNLVHNPLLHKGSNNLFSGLEHQVCSSIFKESINNHQKTVENSESWLVKIQKGCKTM
jgi:hypothetical protein